MKKFLENYSRNTFVVSVAILFIVSLSFVLSQKSPGGMGSTVNLLESTDTGSASLTKLNASVTALNTDKLEDSDLSGGSGITYSSGVISLDNTGDWTGTLDGNEATAFVFRNDWTTHDSYPSACSAGQFVSAIGDTLTCSTPAGGGGGSGGIFSTTTVLAYYNDTEMLIGGSATTSDINNSLEIIGGLFIDEATTTGFTINSERFTDLTGTGLQNSSGVLTLNATGDWTGTFDSQEGTWYIDRTNHTGIMPLTGLALATGNIYVGDGSNNPVGTSTIFIDTNSNIGLGTNTPDSLVEIYKNFPSSNEILFKISTSDDASRFTIDEDGDINTDGSLVSDSSIALRHYVNTPGITMAPSYTFLTDTNTGMYLDGSDGLGLSTGGTGSLFINSSHNVGISTTTQTHEFEVDGETIFYGNSTTTGIMVITDGTNGVRIIPGATTTFQAF